MNGLLSLFLRVVSHKSNSKDPPSCVVNEAKLKDISQQPFERWAVNDPFVGKTRANRRMENDENKDRERG